MKLSDLTRGRLRAASNAAWPGARRQPDRADLRPLKDARRKLSGLESCWGHAEWSLLSSLRWVSAELSGARLESLKRFSAAAPHAPTRARMHSISTCGQIPVRLTGQECIAIRSPVRYTVDERDSNVCAAHGSGGAMTIRRRRPPGDGGHSLTPRRRKILGFIREASKRSGYSPSMQEIADAVGLKSVSTVSYHMEILEEMGYLTAVPGCRVRSCGHHPVFESSSRDGTKLERHQSTMARTTWSACRCSSG